MLFLLFWKAGFLEDIPKRDSHGKPGFVWSALFPQNPSSCHTIEEDVIENRAHRLLFIWQCDLRVQWRRINAELNSAMAMKRNKEMGCRVDSRKGKERGGK